MNRRRLHISTNEARGCVAILLLAVVVIGVRYGVVAGTVLLVSSWFAYMVGYWIEH